jgi:hypothetical protein
MTFGQIQIRLHLNQTAPLTIPTRS